jgi:hypothetical protein
MSARAKPEVTMEMISMRSERTRIFNRIFKNYRDKVFEVLTSDGWNWLSSTAQKPTRTIILRSPRALQALIQGPSELLLGEAWIDGHMDVQGQRSRWDARDDPGKLLPGMDPP